MCWGVKLYCALRRDVLTEDLLGVLENILDLIFGEDYSHYREPPSEISFDHRSDAGKSRGNPLLQKPQSAPKSVKHPIDGNGEADDSDYAKRENWREPAIQFGSVCANRTAKKDRVGQKGQECPSNHVGNIVLLDEQCGECDERGA